MQLSPSVGIVGLGRLGSSLAVALAAAGFRVTAITGRDAAAAETLVRQLGAGVTAVGLPDVADAADILFLTVQDSLIAGVAAAIPWRPGHVAVHCSGALGLDVLASPRAAGAGVGCFHPLQSFPSRTGDAARFRGITCGIEGDDRAAAFLLDAAERLGSRTVRLEGVNRALYHAAAVFAANDAVALMSYASRAWQLAGLPVGAARPALAPLLAGAAANILSAELSQALTGPVARGDVATVERHLAALAAVPPLLDAYRRLGAELLTVAGISDPGARTRLRHLLGDGDS